MNDLERLPFFRSPEQKRLLAELFVFAQVPISLSELARRAATSVGGAHKEVERLEASGLTTSKISGRTRLVEANQGSPLYEDLRGLLTKAFGPEPLLREALSEVAGIEEAFIFGSWADPEELAPQDVDLMLIGEPDTARVYQAVSEVEIQIGRPINVAIRSTFEWESGESGFEKGIKSRPRIPLT